MPRLTDSMGYCYRCGSRPFEFDYAPPTGGVIGVCAECLPDAAEEADDGVYEIPEAESVES